MLGWAVLIVALRFLMIHGTTIGVATLLGAKNAAPHRGGLAFVGQGATALVLLELMSGILGPDTTNSLVIRSGDHTCISLPLQEHRRHHASISDDALKKAGA